MAATVQATISNSTGPTDASAESGIGFGLDDAVTATTPIAKPNSAGTNRSWYKMLSLKVTAGGGSTSLLNRKVSWASSPSAGLTGYFLTAAPSAYTQASSGNKPADDGTTNDSTPASYTALTTTPQTYDSATVAATNSTKNGKFCQVAIGVSNNYTGGAGSSIALPNITLTYDEQ